MSLIKRDMMGIVTISLKAIGRPSSGAQGPAIIHIRVTMSTSASEYRLLSKSKLILDKVKDEMVDALWRVGKG